MNCDRETPDSEGRTFAEVFVCSACYAMAENLNRKNTAELGRMILLSREAIRLALLEKKLHYSAEHAAKEVSKEELLRMIMQMTEKKNGTES
jgi:hypothetical protein